MVTEEAGLAQLASLWEAWWGLASLRGSDPCIQHGRGEGGASLEPFRIMGEGVGVVLPDCESPGLGEVADYSIARERP